MNADESPLEAELSELVERSRTQRGPEADQLFEILYQDLRLVARRQLLKRSRPGTLNTTSLVHEAFLRLHAKELNLQDRAHFRATCARAMRFVLIDYAKARTRLKRGGATQDVEFEEARFLKEERAEQLLSLEAALVELAELEPRLALVVEYRFFAGLTQEEIAEALGVSSMTVKRDWKKAKGFLARELEQ